MFVSIFILKLGNILKKVSGVEEYKNSRDYYGLSLVFAIII